MLLRPLAWLCRSPPFSHSPFDLVAQAEAFAEASINPKEAGLWHGLAVLLDVVRVESTTI